MGLKPRMKKDRDPVDPNNIVVGPRKRVSSIRAKDSDNEARSDKEQTLKKDMHIWGDLSPIMEMIEPSDDLDFNIEEHNQQVSDSQDDEALVLLSDTSSVDDQPVAVIVPGKRKAGKSQAMKASKQAKVIEIQGKEMQSMWSI